MGMTLSNPQRISQQKPDIECWQKVQQFPKSTDIPIAL
jgi:hypothetical protein